MSKAKNTNVALKALENLRLRILDLTTRNRLINFRHTKKGSLRVVDGHMDQIVEVLLSEAEMRFLPVPEPTTKGLVEAGYIEIDKTTGQEIRLLKDPTAEEWAQQLGLGTSYETPFRLSIEKNETRHRNNSMQTLLFPYELEARLKNLMQTAESAIQEMGANILYLAFGALEWFENNNNESRLAPLFLVPVRLQKGRLNQRTKTYEFTVKYSGEDIISNLSLREKLRVDFAMALPELDENTNPEAYFKSVLAIINENQPGWRLRRFITLTLLNFSKLLMYLDLDPARWPENTNIINHPLIRRFLTGYGTKQNEENGSNGDLGFGEEYLIDEVEDIHVKYPLIDDADSSQHSALIDAVDGKNLVIEGPPGTGKSQTITNLIAATMARGKRVLFVAEKLAALEVVRRRLDAAGLGEFCLELHSHKSQKRRVLDEIETRLKRHGRYRLPQKIEENITRYEELKKDLKSYVERINRLWKNTGMTLHEIFMAATRYREAIGINPTYLHPEGYDGDNLDGVTQRRMKDQTESFSKVYEAVNQQIDGNSELQFHPWYGVRNPELQIFDLDRIKSALENWQCSLRELNDKRPWLAEFLWCDLDEIPGSLNGIILLIEDLERIPSLKGDELLDRLPILRDEVLHEAQLYLKLFEDIQLQYAELVTKVGQDVVQDLTRVDSFLAGGEQLSQLVSGKTKLGVLAETRNRLQAIQGLLDELEQPLADIREAVGEYVANDHLSFTETGIVELRGFVELIAELNPAYWELRDVRFDNDELDELLPLLRGELEQLHALRGELQKMFQIDTLPNQHELRRIRKTISSGGIFRWFKRSWRVACKQVFTMAEGHKAKLPKLIHLLSKAEEFSKRRQELDENNQYKDLLGEHFRGIDTALPVLESLRNWYRNVRLKYGYGFGQKVALGNAMIDFPIETARAVRYSADQGLKQNISAFLDHFQALKKIFTLVAELKNNRTLLTGKLGLIARLLESLDKALLLCDPLMTDNAMTTAELIKRIKRLDVLDKSVRKWEDIDCDNKLFRGCLGLKPGVHADNTTSLSRLHNTLAIAVCVDHQLANDAIRRRIYDQPDTSIFQQLKTISIQLREMGNTQILRFQEFTKLVSLEPEDWTKRSGDQLDKLIARNSWAMDNGEALQNWLDYLRIRNQVKAMGLTKLILSVEQDEIDIQQVGKACMAGIFDMLAREILREQPDLGRFSGRNQESLRNQFQEYDIQLKKLQCEKIAWQIDQTIIPIGNTGVRASELTELQLLKREISKKKRHVPIRQLLRRAGKSIVAMKPCFMMGPMSVAQYLAPGQLEFDLIVMDEASQIKPHDALGAVARGNQLVVVGDPKQLPPTSFFDRIADDAEEDPTALEESESILDATLPTFPVRRLRWHYRSQHQDLIAFSNHFFYDSDLMLFPSPHSREIGSYGVQHTRVQKGCFVNRRNMEEARIISEAVRDHFRYHSMESLGVVAMSAEQRLQIENAIETLAKEDYAFQERLEEDSLRVESLFIKNLENVQGDERDVIFISMTYGPQEPGGKVFQRFGPINYDTGWRRLNVLFTRSKKRMHIFSSMSSEDIVADSTAKRGVQALRDFLAFCETGILHKTEKETGRGPDSDFEIAVREALRNEGFQCAPQVGVVGFFIDVAVIDPGNRGRYLMGIECDGATYHAAKSTRDRDRLRQAILERLGWRIRRIWSTDWFKNPRAELKPIIRELNDLKTEGQKGFEQKI